MKTRKWVVVAWIAITLAIAMYLLYLTFAPNPVGAAGPDEPPIYRGNVSEESFGVGLDDGSGCVRVAFRYVGDKTWWIETSNLPWAYAVLVFRDDRGYRAYRAFSAAEVGYSFTTVIEWSQVTHSGSLGFIGSNGLPMWTGEFLWGEAGFCIRGFCVIPEDYVHRPFPSSLLLWGQDNRPEHYPANFAYFYSDGRVIGRSDFPTKYSPEHAPCAKMPYHFSPASAGWFDRDYPPVYSPTLTPTRTPTVRPTATNTMPPMDLKPLPQPRATMPPLR